MIIIMKLIDCSEVFRMTEQELVQEIARRAELTIEAANRAYRALQAIQYEFLPSYKALSIERLNAPNNVHLHERVINFLDGLT